MSMDALKFRIRQMQQDLDQLTQDKDTVSGNDILKMSMQLDDLIVEYTRAINSN